jgi:uncharacterized membrane protein YedE/YeeE
LHSFVYPLIGGALIGLAASILLLLSGRVAGISGIVAGALTEADDRRWRVAFISGLLLGGLLLARLRPESFVIEIHRSSLVLGIAGLLVGFGTQLGSGCTSGHGVCGISRLSLRSIVATLTFIGTGALSVYAYRQIFGG